MIDFDGTRNAGICVPKISGFPKSGYTFACWIRIEKYQKNIQPRLLSLTATDQSDLEIFFVENAALKVHQLAVSISIKSKKFQVTFGYTFRENYCYHVVVSHSFSYFTTSTIQLYVNGQMIQKDSIKYPSFTLPYIENCYIGTNKLHCFYGQMRGIYFFKDSLSERDVENIYSLGSNYSYNHSSKSFLKVDKEILFAYTPESFKPDQQQKYILDCSIEILDKIQKRCVYNGILLPGSKVLTSKLIKDIFFQSGSFNLLFPFFEIPLLFINFAKINDKHAEKIKEDISRGNKNLITQFVDLELGEATGHIEKDSENEYKLLNELGNYHGYMIELVTNLIRDSIQIQKEIQKTNDFRMIHFLLKKNGAPFNLSVFLLQEIKKLIQLPQVRGNINLYRKIMKEFFLDISLWSAGTYEFLEFYLIILHQEVKSNLVFFNQEIGISWFIEIIKSYFSIKPIMDLKNVNSILPNYSSLPNKRLSRKQMKALRKKVFLIMLELLQSPSSTQSLAFSPTTIIGTGKDHQSLEANHKLNIKLYLNYLLQNTDEYQLDNLIVYQKLLLIFHTKNQLKFSFQYMENELGWIFPFINLLSSNNQKVRIISLKIISLILKNSSKKIQKTYPLPIIFNLILEKLQLFEFNYVIYYCLLDLAISPLPDHDFYNFPQYSIFYQSYLKLQLKEFQSFYEIKFFSILFHLANFYRISDDLMESILVDLKTIFTENTRQIYHFLEIKYFPQWIISCYLFCKRSNTFPSPASPRGVTGPESEVLPKDLENSFLKFDEIISSIIYQIFHYLLIKKDSWKFIEYFCNFFNFYTNTEEDSYLRYLFYKLLLNAILDQLKKHQVSTQAPSTLSSSISINRDGINNLFANCFYILFQFDEYLFYPIAAEGRFNLSTVSRHIRYHPKFTTKWVDFHFSLSIIEMIDYLSYFSGTTDIEQEILTNKNKNLKFILLHLFINSIHYSFPYLLDFVNDFTFIDNSLPLQQHQQVLTASTERLINEFHDLSNPSAPSTPTRIISEDSFGDFSSSSLTNLQSEEKANNLFTLDDDEDEDLLSSPPNPSINSPSGDLPAASKQEDSEFTSEPLMDIPLEDASSADNKFIFLDLDNEFVSNTDQAEENIEFSLGDDNLETIIIPDQANTTSLRVSEEFEVIDDSSENGYNNYLIKSGIRITKLLTGTGNPLHVKYTIWAIHCFVSLVRKLLRSNKLPPQKLLLNISELVNINLEEINTFLTVNFPAFSDAIIDSVVDFNEFYSKFYEFYNRLPKKMMKLIKANIETEYSMYLQQLTGFIRKKYDDITDIIRTNTNVRGIHEESLLKSIQSNSQIQMAKTEITASHLIDECDNYHKQSKRWDKVKEIIYNHERFPFFHSFLNENYPNARIFWKLDGREDHQKRRWLLKRNYKGSDYYQFSREYIHQQEKLQVLQKLQIEQEREKEQQMILLMNQDEKLSDSISESQLMPGEIDLRSSADLLKSLSKEIQRQKDRNSLSSHSPLAEDSIKQTEDKELNNTENRPIENSVIDEKAKENSSKQDIADNKSTNEPGSKEKAGENNVNDNTTQDNEGELLEEEIEEKIDESEDELDEWTFMENKAFKNEQEILTTTCDLITPGKTRRGTFDITNKAIYFQYIENSSTNIQPSLYPDENQNSRENKYSRERINFKKWELQKIVKIFKRRFLLRYTAIEIYLRNKKTIFLDFTENQQNQIFNTIIKLAKNIRKEDLNIKKSLEILKINWQKRKITNFQYLMKLNEYSGRTYNDLSQYPVFPWILKDYESEKLNLNDEKIYRELNKPVGALNRKRLEEYESRYNELKLQEQNFDENDPNLIQIPPFFYGSHYSTELVVLYYLIRLEPFTTFYLHLQDGRFDHADRLFFSIPIAWKNSYSLSQDVKELIPEFFYNANFLKNHNKLHLGERQEEHSLLPPSDPSSSSSSLSLLSPIPHSSSDLVPSALSPRNSSSSSLLSESAVERRKIDDVELPAWASSPEQFISIHREALESEYVSAHLHEWINLIFGYQQTGEEARKAKNVFYYLTYENSMNIHEIQDELLRKSIIQQIKHFGQTPTQLFKIPHPSRNEHLPLLKSPSGSIPPLASSGFSQLFKSPCNLFYSNFAQLSIVQKITTNFNAANMFVEHKKVILVSNYGEFALFKFNFTPNSSQSHQDKSFGNLVITQSLLSPQKAIFALNLPQNKKYFYSPFYFDAENKFILSFFHWDSTIRLSSLQINPQIKQNLQIHQERIISYFISENKKYLITGSEDCLLYVFLLEKNKNHSLFQIRKDPIFLLKGHQSSVTCISANSDIGLVVSGSADGSIISHSLFNGRFVRYFPDDNLFFTKGIDIILILPSIACVVAYSNFSNYLVLFDINGLFLNAVLCTNLNLSITRLIATKDAKFLISAGNKLGFWSVEKFNCIKMLDMDCKDVALSPDQNLLFVTTPKETYVIPTFLY